MASNTILSNDASSNDMNPSEIARETLKRLAQQRTPPTPDNYRAIYHEIAGTVVAEPFPEKSLKSLTSALPRKTQEQLRLARQIETAVGDKSWDALKSSLNDLFTKLGADPPNWGTLIREIITRLEIRQAELTPARKREALDHVLASSTSPELLHTRLQGLLKNWAQAGAIEESLADPVPDESIADAVPPASTFESAPATGSGSLGKGITGELLELLAQLLESAIGILLADNAELADEASRLAASARKSRGTGDVSAFIAAMKRFSYRLSFVAEDQAEIRSGLLHLLQLVIDNINELVLDDQWLQGQIAIVLDLVNQPLNLRRLDDVERRIKDVIFKQGALKKSLMDAQDRLKSMLATFVDRLADFSESTSGYHDTIERCAQRISQASDIGELTEVLDEVMRETRTIQINAQRSRDELNEMRTRVTEAEKEIERLQQDLANASDMVRIDALTGVLNRKGMDEAFETEVARMQRHGGALCLALLDIDNFKKLNDSLGHAAGDAALVHLARVVHEAIRPEDTLARYGGEEFVVILPNTLLDDGVNAMVRVQRELTRRFFLHNNEKLLITFSCGVAQLRAGETAAAALERADGAMYLAKRAGKNRVMAA